MKYVEVRRLRLLEREKGALIGVHYMLFICCGQIEAILGPKTEADTKPEKRKVCWLCLFVCLYTYIMP